MGGGVVGCKDKLSTCDPINVSVSAGLLSFSMLSYAYGVHKTWGQCLGLPARTSLLFQRGGFRALPKGLEEALLLGLGIGGHPGGCVVLLLATGGILPLGGARLKFIGMLAVVIIHKLIAIGLMFSILAVLLFGYQQTSHSTQRLAGRFV